MPRTKNDLIHYQRKGAGYPMVLIHGVGGNLSNWDQVCDHLLTEFDVVRLDLRGHGASGPIDKLSIDIFAEDVINMMDDEGIEQAHLVGFSLGGLIAQRLAVTNPDRFNRIVLLSAVAGRTAEERKKVLARLDFDP
ncbi:alpha/beta fold hydrolase [Ochrobactrum teleogrylli]